MHKIRRRREGVQKRVRVEEETSRLLVPLQQQDYFLSLERERGRGKEGRKDDGDGERDVKRSLARNGNLSCKRERGRDLLLMCSYAHRRARVG